MSVSWFNIKGVTKSRLKRNCLRHLTFSVCFYIYTFHLNPPTPNVTTLAVCSTPPIGGPSSIPFHSVQHPPIHKPQPHPIPLTTTLNHTPPLPTSHSLQLFMIANEVQDFPEKKRQPIEQQPGLTLRSKLCSPTPP